MASRVAIAADPNGPDRSPGRSARLAPEPVSPSVPVELDQPCVADPEVVGDLVSDDVPHLALEPLPIAAAEAVQGPAVDRDPVRPLPAAEDALLGQRYALVRGEPPLPGW